MKTIEERTRDQEKSQFTEEELERLHKLHGVNSAFGIGYYLGATDQREIDIERACKEFKFFLDRLVEKDADALRQEILQADVKVWYEDFKNIMNDAQD